MDMPHLPSCTRLSVQSRRPGCPLGLRTVTLKSLTHTLATSVAFPKVADKDYPGARRGGPQIILKESPQALSRNCIYAVT